MKLKYILFTLAMSLTMMVYATQENPDSTINSADKDPVKPVEAAQNVVAGFPTWAGVLLVILCLILLAGVVVAFMRMQKIEENIREKSDRIKKLKGQVDNDKIIIDEELKSLGSQIRVVMKLAETSATARQGSPQNSFSEHDGYAQRIQGFHQPVEGERFVPNSDPTDSKPTFRKQYFFGCPQDGLFTRGEEVFKPGFSVYSIIDTGRAEAEFTLVERPEAKGAIRKSITRNLEPACDVKGDIFRAFSDIRVLKPGRVRKTNNGWVIIKKAYVELIGQ